MNTNNLTKAKMLVMLKQNIDDINILPVLIVTSENFFSDTQKTVNKIIAFSQGKALAVRSSSVNEDTCEYSNAGKFESILNVTSDSNAIEEAVKRVYLSYGTKENGEILIQPMLENVKISGVVFTRDIDTDAEYYVVNYTEGSDTSMVTGGSGRPNTYVRYKKSPYENSESDFESLFSVCRNIEKFLDNDALDIEFAITEDNTVYILQVRPLAKGKKNKQDRIDISAALKRIFKKVSKLSKRHPFLLGHTTCFGVMPDWNPAEILGVRPKKLAISLYKELITDSVWARQRAGYGYRDLTMHPLMISFCGIPYIDTRITFNSFIPKDLNPAIAEKLACYYIDMLAKFPKYHDKIEFEIVYSCYYLGIHEKLRELEKYGFNDNEITRIEFSLLNLTNKIIDHKTGLYLKDLNKIHKLETNYSTILESDISLVDKIYWLIEECKEYGTLPFAGIARAGFIAVQFLRSFVDTGILTREEYDLYMNSLNTINKQMNFDLLKYHAGSISKEEFLQKYGHIRPGTYDIMSLRYDEAFDEYFSSDNLTDVQSSLKEYEFSSEKMERIQRELDENGLLISADELISFIKLSIEGREYLKFIFTKYVSKILKLVEELGNRLEIDKADMAHIDISLIKQLYVDLFTGNPADLFRENINNNKKQYEQAVKIKLPSIIVKPENVYSFYQLDEEPNYITQGSVIAKTIVYGEDSEDITGKIVFIQSADPGYDFIFTKDIVGLVTQFGGANSHMAIRCAELNIPAVIGVGEVRFKEWSSWKKAELNCLLRQMIRIE